MTLLQPWMLYALPLVFLPVVIHLLNRSRHRPVAWAAILFLRRARRRDRGRSRLRHLLILLARMLAVAFLLLAAGRPLVSGLPSSWGWDRPDATLVMLDRSPSMEAAEVTGGPSRRLLLLERLAGLLSGRDRGRDLILVDSTGGATLALESPSDLLDPVLTGPVDARADLPAMLERAHDWLLANEVARADLWICADAEEAAWDADGGRWTAIRERLAGSGGVALYHLSMPEPGGANRAVRVSRVRRRQAGEDAALYLDLAVQTGVEESVPVELEIGEQRFTLEVEGGPGEAVLRNARIPLDSTLRSGWGQAVLPPDANPADNRFYFVFAEPPLRRAAIVTADEGLGAALRLALEIPSVAGAIHQADILPPERAASIDWEGLSLLVWQAPAPGRETEERIRAHVEAGGVVFCLPPGEEEASLLGYRWTAREDPEGGQRLSWWRNDADLLARTVDGEALALQAVRVHRFRGLQAEGESVPLARLEDGRPLLQRLTLGRGALYFWGTLPLGAWSNLQEDVLPIYVMLQRALERGSLALAAATGREAGAELAASLAEARMLAPARETGLPRGLQAGVFRVDEEWIAVNRSGVEDTSPKAEEGLVDSLFEGLSYRRIGEAVPTSAPLAREFWSILFLVMLGALLLEAFLCLPPPREIGTGRVRVAEG